MSRYVEVMAIVEGSTEETFINRILAPYLSHRNIGMRATQVSKPGEKGGDVKFSRVKNDIRLHLKQRPDTIVATFLDYYAIKEWPGLESIPSNPSPSQIESILCVSTMSEMKSFLHGMTIEHRFIPFFIIHEFEKKDRLHLAIAPEGTRKAVKKWKTGFHTIARAANVPVYLGYFDWGTKRVGHGPRFELSDNAAADLAKIQAIYEEMHLVGKHPEGYLTH